MELCNLTWQKAKEWTLRNPVVIVPTGSTEQHGPHLPLKVDIASSDYIARKVAEKTNMLVTPPLNFGYSELWHRYPGTISFTQETFRGAIQDICASLIRGGFKKIFIINGHSPNLPLIQSAIYHLIDLYGEKGIQIGGGSYGFMAKNELDKIGENAKDGTHANERETSISLALFPEHVNMQIAHEISKTYKMRKVITFDPGATIVNRWPDSSLFNGVYGNPSLASAETGKAYLEALIKKISQIVLNFDEGKFNPSMDDGIPQDF